MPETTPLIKAALNLRVGVGFDVYYALANNYIFFAILPDHIQQITSNYRSLIFQFTPLFSCKHPI